MVNLNEELDFVMIKIGQNCMKWFIMVRLKSGVKENCGKLKHHIVELWGSSTVLKV